MSQLNWQYFHSYRNQKFSLINSSKSCVCLFIGIQYTLPLALLMKSKYRSSKWLAGLEWILEINPIFEDPFSRIIDCLLSPCQW